MIGHTPIRLVVRAAAGTGRLVHRADVFCELLQNIIIGNRRGGFKRCTDARQPIHHKSRFNPEPLLRYA